MYLVRHAPVSDNSANVIRGQSDVPVHEEGVKIADLRARRFMDMPVRQIRSAADERSLEMAEALQRYTGAPIAEDYRLSSWNLGDLQGRTVTPAVRAMIFEYMTGKASQPVPGGESRMWFLSRLLPYIKESLDQEELICVTHFHCIGAVMAWDAAGREGISQDAATLKRDHMIDHCQVVLLTPTECTPIVMEDMRTVPEAI